MNTQNEQPLSGWKDKILFTPGPLTTSHTVKQARLRDLGSRDFEFIEIVREIMPICLPDCPTALI